MPSDPKLTGQSRKRGLPKHSQHYTRPCQAPVPATGPQESAAVSARSERSISYAVAAVLLPRKSVASTRSDQDEVRIAYLKVLIARVSGWRNSAQTMMGTPTPAIAAAWLRSMLLQQRDARERKRGNL